MVAERKKTTSERAGAGESEQSEQPKERRPDFLTARQLAEVLQVSESTVHRLRRSGRIPALLLTDKLIRFNLKDVTRALRPTDIHARREGDEDSASSPQLSFEDLYSDFQK